MIATCSQCQMSLSFEDHRLPNEPFNVVCPRCRSAVTIMPPPKQEPSLAGTPKEETAGHHRSHSGTDILTQLVELLSGSRNPQQPLAEADKWQRRNVLICLEDPALREHVRASLDPKRYEVFMADIAQEALEIMQESPNDIIIMSPSFDADHQGGATMMQFVNRLSPAQRRRTYIVLISPQLRTMDTYLAFANGVNLTIRPEDIGSFNIILDRSVRDFNDIYRAFNQASSIDPF